MTLFPKGDFSGDDDMLRREDVEQKEEHIRKRINRLTGEERKRYYQIAKKRVRDPDTYAVLVYFSMVGIHHIYLGKHARGIINITMFLFGLILLLSGHIIIGILLMFVVPIIELWDLFRSQIIVQDRNNQIMEATLDELN